MISIDQSNYFATKSITYVYKIDFTFETTSIILENLNSKTAFLSAKKSWFLQTKVNLKKSESLQTEGLHFRSKICKLSDV